MITEATTYSGNLRRCIIFNDGRRAMFDQTDYLEDMVDYTITYEK